MKASVAPPGKALVPISKRYRQGIFIVSCSMLLLYLLVAILYTSQALKSQFLAKERISLDHTVESLQILLSTVEDYSKAILSDDTVQEILSSPHFFDESDTIAMRKQISRYILSSHYFDAVLIYDAYGRVYDGGGIARLRTDKTRFSSISAPVWSATHAPPYIQSVKATQKRILSFVRPIYSFRDTKKIGVIELCLDERNITRTFLPSTARGTYYIVDENNTIIAHPNASLLMSTDPVPLLPDGAVYQTASDYTISRLYEYTGWYMKSTTPVRIIFQPLYQMLAVFFILGILLIGLGILFSGKTASAITGEITSLTSAVKKVSGYKERIPMVASSNETETLCVEFNVMLDKLETTAERLIEEQAQKRKFQLELLQQQMNPHFLYNTLENICSLSDLGQNKQVVELVHYVARFYRGVLSKGDVLIPLESEIRIAESYMEILKIRSRSRFDYTLRIAPEFYHNICIKLVLQPVIENAFYHGFTVPGRHGQIEIAAYSEEKVLVLQVCDNGAGMDAQTAACVLSQSSDIPRRSYGLKNIHERLQLYFGQEYGLRISSRQGEGTRIQIRLPRQNWRKEYDDQDHIG